MRYPRRCYVEDNFTKLWACIAEVLSVQEKEAVYAETDLHDCGVSQLDI